MMNVVIADIGREPAHKPVHFYITGGIKRCLEIVPMTVITEYHGWKIVLRIKDVATNREHDQAWNNQ